jgi:hypothetical protein
MSASSSAESHAADPLVGTIIAKRYAVQRVIGRGGMGVVYLAHDEQLDRPVAVKVLAPKWAGDTAVLARFEREAARLAELRHPNIVEMYDFGHADGRAYLVMEYLVGELLGDYLDRTGALPVQDFVPIAAQILKGIGHAHTHEIMFRDIKPSNMMLVEKAGRRNFVKVLDFGLAKLLKGDDQITEHYVVGTAGFLSPEQIKGLPLDLRVDVYGLGVLFYLMLTGRMPFEAGNHAELLYKHVNEPPPPLASTLPPGHEVPEDLIELVHSCLAKDPDERPTDANEVVEGLIDAVPAAMFRLPRADTGAATSSSTGLTSVFPTLSEKARAELAASGSGAGLAPPVIASASMSAAIPDTGVTFAEAAAHSATLAAAPAGPPIAKIVGVVIAGLALGGLAIVLFPPDRGAPEPAIPAASAGAAATAALGPELDAIEALVAKAEWDAAAAKLEAIEDTLDGGTSTDKGRFKRLDEAVAVGRLLVAAAKLEDEGQAAAALSAYRDALARDPANATARAAVARLEAASKGDEPAAMGPVSIASEPPGSLFIDDLPTGTTPFAADLTLGSHAVRVEAEGYKPWTGTIDVKAAGNVPVKLTLEPRPKGWSRPAAGKRPDGSGTSEPAAAPAPAPAPAADEGDDLFLPTSKKKKQSGVFLPVGD